MTHHKDVSLADVKSGVEALASCIAKTLHDISPEAQQPLVLKLQDLYQDLRNDGKTELDTLSLVSYFIDLLKEKRF